MTDEPIAPDEGDLNLDLLNANDVEPLPADQVQDGTEQGSGQ